jgi:photosystem II stability/assembly factor-like uncharacterized protein
MQFVEQSPGVRRLLVSAWREAVYYSDDGGEVWQKATAGLSTDRQADQPDFLLPHFSRMTAHQGVVYLAGFDGLFYSQNAGQSWRQVQTWPIGYLSRMALSPPTSGETASAIVAYGGGAYLIPDASADDWMGQAESLTLAGRPGIRTDSGISDIAFSPDYPRDHTFFAATEHELIRSSNSGRNWERVEIKKPFVYRLRKKGDYYLRRLGVSQSIRLKLMGFFPLIPGWSTFIAISPDFTRDGTIFFSTQGLGQCRSNDGGVSCAVVLDTALKMTSSMAISPQFEQDGTLFVAVRGDGIYQTTDGGDRFEKIGAKLPLTGRLLLGISPEFQRDRTLFVGTGKGLFGTQDAGSHWHSMGGESLPLKGTLLAVAVSPDFAQDRSVIVAVKGFGLFKSVDGGAHFMPVGQQVLRENEQIQQIVFSGNYRNDKTVFGMSADHVFRSQDGGQSWQRLLLPVRTEDVQDSITYSGDWTVRNSGAFSDSTETRSNTIGSKAAFRFFGTGIRWLSHRSPAHGEAKITLDGSAQILSLTAKDDQPATAVFVSQNLPRKSHEIEIEVVDSGTSSAWVSLDAFEVLP